MRTRNNEIASHVYHNVFELLDSCLDIDSMLCGEIATECQKIALAKLVAVPEEPTVRLSDLVFGKSILFNARLPIPNSDAVRIVKNENDLKNFIEEYGDQKIFRDDDSLTKWNIPAFDEDRKRYSDSKQVWCNQYGCE